MDYNNLVSKELLQYLEEMFPDRLPPYKDVPNGTDIKEIVFLQGQQSVVARLTQLYEEDYVWENTKGT
tara:strand:+ start:668 stop:871 length:204 start_codon:yes stop_codon:yes gene_type:complete